MKYNLTYYLSLLLFSLVITEVHLSSAILTLFSAVIIQRLLLKSLEKTKINLRLSCSYLIFIIKEIFFSTLDITKIIWSTKLTTLSTFRKINSHSTQRINILYATSITLTPGTVSINLDEKSILVHGISKESLNLLEKGDLKEKIIALNQ